MEFRVLAPIAAIDLLRVINQLKLRADESTS